ncbi:unnamed protein product [Dicrocoelium dendriticum]|nr:unnamed protein product [Dicrocoelium dendriticum]
MSFAETANTNPPRYFWTTLPPSQRCVHIWKTNRPSRSYYATPGSLANLAGSDRSQSPNDQGNSLRRLHTFNEPIILNNGSNAAVVAPMESRLSWRSHSQPPFTDADRSLPTGNVSPAFLNTESTQQIPVTTTTETTTCGHRSNDRSSFCSTITVSSGAQSRLRSIHSAPRSSSIRPRLSASRRAARSFRSIQCGESNMSSSSSSNNSLVGRYRTISGALPNDTASELCASDTRLSALLRSASLRLDNESIESPTAPHALVDGSSDLDEFPALPVRSRTDQAAISACLSSNSGLPHLHFRPRPVSDGAVAGLLVANCSASPSSICNTADVVSNVAPPSTPLNETSLSQIGCERLDSSAETDSITITPSGATDVTTLSTVRFPTRHLREQTAGDGGTTSSTNTHQEPEADHDFYRSNSSRIPYRCNEHWQRILIGLNDLRQGGHFCDVILQAGAVKISAHRNVLAASSRYFNAMFTGPMAEARSPCVQIQGIDGDALIQLIDFIYTGEILVTEDTVQSLLPAANLLQLGNVRAACCEFLQSQLHPSNCLGIQRFADLHDCPDLLAYSRRFTEQHFGELLQQDDEFLALTADQLEQLISSDQLAVSEDQVFEAVLRWIAHDSDTRQRSARRLCGHVRFALFPRDYLVRLSQSEVFLTANPWCKDYLIEALSYHLLSWEQKLRVTSERARPRTPIGLPKVLIVIGGQAPKAIRSVEMYEFRTGLWRSSDTDSHLTSVAQASESAQSTAGSGSPSPSMSPTTSARVSVTGSCNSSAAVVDLPSRRCRCGVAVVGGLVYIVGGFNGALRVRSVEIYDPIRNIWHSGPNMECRRATLGVAVLNGHIYAVGGFDGNSGLNSVEVFDMWSGNWRFIASMSCRRSSVGAGALDGRIYAVGGYDGVARRCLSSVECYDPVTNMWTPVADMTCRSLGVTACFLSSTVQTRGS